MTKLKIGLTIGMANRINHKRDLDRAWKRRLVKWILKDPTTKRRNIAKIPYQFKGMSPCGGA